MAFKISAEKSIRSPKQDMFSTWKEILQIDHPQDKRSFFELLGESLYGLFGVASYQYELRSNEYGTGLHI